MTEGTETITAIHFAWMGLLAVLVVIGIIAGMRLKRRRVEAQREVEAHAEEAGVEIAQPSTEAEPAPKSTAPATESSPPPIADSPVATAPPLSGSDADGDDSVTRLKGLGPKVAARLEELGITRVGQLAALDEAQAAALDADLGPFAGRLAKDRWVEQARLLAAGDRDGFERVFGRL